MSTLRSFRFTNTIRFKLLAACLFLLIVPILVVGTVSYDASKKESDALIEKNIRNNVQFAVELANSFTESVRNGTMKEEDAQERVKSLLLGPKQDGKRPINANIDLGPNGYFYVLDQKGVLLAHPLLEGQNIWDKKSSDGTYYIQEIIDHAVHDGGGFTYYKWPLPNSETEEMKVVYGAYFAEWEWVIAAGSYMIDYNAGQTHIFKVIILTLAACVAVGFLFSLLFARHIARPLVRVTAETRRIADGDLTETELRIRNNDEIGRLAGMFGQMRGSLRQLVNQIGGSSDQVSGRTARLSASIQEITQASNQIASSIHDISAATHTQASNVEESANAMEEMAAGIQRIAETSSSALEVSESTAREAEQGQQQIKLSIRQMDALRTTVNDLAGVIRLLDDRSHQIGDIVQAITEIADQTNLLALNAAIEAARAGESGKGFAVVATEVRKLAERSSQSAQQVAELIAVIQDNISFAVKEMARSDQEVNTGVESVTNSGIAFEHILLATKQVVEHIQEASAASEQMSASAQQVAASLQDMRKMAGESASAAQTISGFTEEQLAAMEEVESASKAISGMALELQQAAHRFKL
ncbi:methyl-accepting chemotaxis protein [Paenibacillus sp. MBLB4367]|uniref:methyl-accepting chemotaxis protein n=1 Tax=Paenibacillus sp. MBLB4367 TaxID=3384767 RepID=UPI00390804F4